MQDTFSTIGVQFENENDEILHVVTLACMPYNIGDVVELYEETINDKEESTVVKDIRVQITAIKHGIGISKHTEFNFCNVYCIVKCIELD